MTEGDVSSDVVRYTTKELLTEIRKELIGVREDTRDRFHKLISSIAGLDLRLTKVEIDVLELQKEREETTPILLSLQKVIDEQMAVKKALEEQNEANAKRKEATFGLREKIAAAFVSFSLLGIEVFRLVHNHL